MSSDKNDRPRTGNGRDSGVKPGTVGILQMRTRGTLSQPTRQQPPGWGVAKVVSIFSRRTS